MKNNNLQYKMAGKNVQQDIYQLRNYKNYAKTKNMKNDTYEYRKFVERPNLDVSRVEIGSCTEKVLMNELKKPFNGRFYHTTDTNKFYFDFNNKRYQLNLFGGSGDAIDLSEYAKKSDVPKKTSQLRNDSGFLTVTTLKDFLSANKYVTKSMLEESLSGFVKKSEFNTLSGKVDDLTGEVGDVRTSLDTLSGTVDTMSGDVSDIRNEIEELRRRIEEFDPGSESEEMLDELYRRIDALESYVATDNNWDEFERE